MGDRKAGKRVREREREKGVRGIGERKARKREKRRGEWEIEKLERETIGGK